MKNEIDTQNNLKKKISSKGIVIILVTILLVSALGLYGYARYITRIKGTAKADIAKFNFKVNDKTDELFVIDLGTTRAGVAQQANVQDGYVGPGTAGKFDLVVDASGSETSLEYEIKMNIDYENNTRFPKNLIFYYDSDMTNAIYHENNIINFNGYMAYSDNDKIHTKTIYWRWDYETGQTQEEVNENDEADSIWMGEKVSLSINVLGRQVNNAPNSNQCAVTFDASGGILEDYVNSEKATKMVTYNEQYGDMPIPKRDGYKFVGWNGKNHFDERNWLLAIKNATYDSDSGFYTFIVNDAHNLYGRNDSHIPFESFRENTQYTYTIMGYVEGIEGNDNTLKFYFKYTDGTKSYVDLRSSTNTTVRYTSNIGKTIEKSFLSWNTGGVRVYIYHIQLEEGETATEFEPYIISSLTKVTQNKEHIVTAIWEKE